MYFPRALAILASPGVTHAHPGAPDPRVDAERTVQTYVDSPSCVPALVSALVSDGLASAATRHLAAVLLSAAADRPWSALGDDGPGPSPRSPAPTTARSFARSCTPPTSWLGTLRRTGRPGASSCPR